MNFVDYHVSPALLARIMKHSEDGEVLDPRTMEDIEALRTRVGLPSEPENNYQFSALQDTLQGLKEPLAEMEIYMCTIPPAFTESVSWYVLEEEDKRKEYIYFHQQAEEFARRDGLLVLYFDFAESKYGAVRDLFARTFGDKLTWNGIHYSIQIKLDPRV